MFFSLSRPSALIERPVLHEVNDSGRVIVAHYTVPVKPAPVTPVPAATLVLLRDRSAGAFEVLLIRRHRASKFAAGDFVFPGGKIEVSDGRDDAAGWCRSVDAAQAARRLDPAAPPPAGRGHWVGGLPRALGGGGDLPPPPPRWPPGRGGGPRHSAGPPA